MRAENQQTAKNLITIACAVFAVLLIVALIISLVSLASASTRRTRLERELAAVTAQVEQNEASIAYYSSDEYVEWVAREYLDMQGKDEIAFTGN
ncbi:MAG: septum formation initiator family protein [Clostridiales bacterium]|nr:septum formation initiator family protein [Clostridiales bacterium]